MAAPAKLNLGLEILGPRPDGYHEIVTIFQAIDLIDHVTLRPADDLALTRSLPGVPDEANLALLALRCLRQQTGQARGGHLTIAKAIPMAAGLGGASSDAAATLLAATALWDLDPAPDLQRLAADLGSDVPFFLQGGTALASGRGEVLAALPAPTVWAVVVSPQITIPRKTATLYQSLLMQDFSTGDLVRDQAQRLSEGFPLDPRLLGNAFARPLYALRPELAKIPARMRASGASEVALSGAGPSHYALFAEPGAAQACGDRLATEFRDEAQVNVATTLGPPISVMMK